MPIVTTDVLPTLLEICGLPAPEGIDGASFAPELRVVTTLEPRTLRTCVLLDKPERRIEPIQADHVGFTIPNEFVVGYGLDFAERFRNLPYVGVLKPEAYTAPTDR